LHGVGVDMALIFFGISWNIQAVAYKRI
jgi:hypothetical protein